MAVSVKAAKADSGYTVEREFVGRVEAARRSAVGFELAGRLAAVSVDEGDRVAAGDVLASMDYDRLAARRAELRAALAQTQADLSLASATRQRVEEAVDFNGVSLQEVDEARERERALMASVRLARARVDTIEVDIEKSTLTAPYAAVVVRRMADEGQVLGAGQPVLELLEIAAPEARIGIAGDAVSAVRPGETISVFRDAERFEATVRAVLPQRDVASRTVDVILDLPADQGLLPGDLVRVRLGREQTMPGFWVPVGALSEAARGLWSVYVAEPLAEVEDEATHRLVRRTVEILHAGDDQVYVAGTLREGDAVVTDGLQRIVPGQLVAIETRARPPGPGSRAGPTRGSDNESARGSP